MASMWSNNLKISIFGESHGSAIGVVIDNLPAGEKIDFCEILHQMKRRAPGNFGYSSQRKERDIPQILSGILDNITTGAPICAIFNNENYDSLPYLNMKDLIRPGHADYTAALRYSGFNDVRGGGHLSGRLTAPLVFAGAICRQILEKKGIHVGAHIKTIGSVHDEKFGNNIDKNLLKKLSKSDSLALVDESLKEKFIDEINKYKNAEDSIGGTIECAVVGVPAGIGSPIFWGVENIISSLIFAIPAVTGIEFGNGFDCAKLPGSKNNDEFLVENNKIVAKTNNHGGILGGITSGMPVFFSVAIKPTPSIRKEQQTVNMKTLLPEKIKIWGQHDPCIVPRALPCVEAVAAIAILDCLLYSSYKS